MRNLRDAQLYYKYAGETKCATPHVTQEALEKAFVQVIQQVLSQKDEILTACREALDEAFDTMELDRAAGSGAGYGGARQAAGGRKRPGAKGSG